MSIQCVFGHKWNGCKCVRCGKVRNEGHVFNLIPGKCEEQCEGCGMVRGTAHQWDGCRCKQCGDTRDMNHNYKPLSESSVFYCDRCGGYALRLDPGMNDISYEDMDTLIAFLKSYLGCFFGEFCQHFKKDKLLSLDYLRTISEQMKRDAQWFSSGDLNLSVTDDIVRNYYVERFQRQVAFGDQETKLRKFLCTKIEQLEKCKHEDIKS